MLEIGNFSSLYAQSIFANIRFQMKIRAEDYAEETIYISNFKVVICGKYVNLNKIIKI